MLREKANCFAFEVDLKDGVMPKADESGQEPLISEANLRADAKSNPRNKIKASLWEVFSLLREKGKNLKAPQGAFVCRRVDTATTLVAPPRSSVAAPPRGFLY